MLRTLFITLLAAASCGATYAADTQKFTVTGKIDGLQKGDTLRFERVTLPGWNLEQAFDVIVAKPGVFSHKGTQEHDQYYLMTYFPKEGKAKVCDRSGKTLIVTDGNKIRMTGTADDIYYCTLTGGIYDDPLLSEYLRLNDSTGQIRGSYLRQADEAIQRKDTATSQEWARKFNLFYQDNPGIERMRAAKKAYQEANPHGTLDRLVDQIAALSYTPTEEAEATYETLSPELKESYYGRLYAKEMAAMKRLAKGQPAPHFSLVTTDGKTVTNSDYKGGYLLIYHWGMCPGSIYIDGQVRALYDKYKDKGLKMLGLTESIATIRQIYEGLPKDKKTEGPGVGDIRPVLGGMLEHGWTEAELETDQPGNKAVMNAFSISGWPFFVLIGPDGTILARDFTEGFYEARTILDKELGGEKAE